MNSVDEHVSVGFKYLFLHMSKIQEGWEEVGCKFCITPTQGLVLHVGWSYTLHLSKSLSYLCVHMSVLCW